MAETNPINGKLNLKWFAIACIFQLSMFLAPTGALGVRILCMSQALNVSHYNEKLFLTTALLIMEHPLSYKKTKCAS